MLLLLLFIGGRPIADHLLGIMATATDNRLAWAAWTVDNRFRGHFPIRRPRNTATMSHYDN
jgi:hypothetical protein